VLLWLPRKFFLSLFNNKSSFGITKMLKFFKLKNIFILWRVQSRDYWKSSKTYKQNSIKLRVSRNPWSLSKSQEIFYMIFLFFNFLIEQAFGFGHTCYNFFHKTAVMDDVNTVRSHSSITNTPPLALKLSFISQKPLRRHFNYLLDITFRRLL